MPCVSFFRASLFGTNSIPHLGHLPGLSETTSGCITQVYFGIGVADGDPRGQGEVCGQALSIA